MLSPLSLQERGKNPDQQLVDPEAGFPGPAEGGMRPCGPKALAKMTYLEMYFSGSLSNFCLHERLQK
jgi:hypothetical protein